MTQIKKKKCFQSNWKLCVTEFHNITNSTQTTKHKPQNTKYKLQNTLKTQDGHAYTYPYTYTQSNASDYLLRERWRTTS